MGLIESQNEILAALRALPNLSVHDDELADEVTVELVPGSDQIRPFLTVSFGGEVEAPRRINGIAGAAKDTAESTIVIQAVASTAGGARATMQRARNVLLGFTPTNCGEIRNALFGATGKLSHLGNPTRYASNQSFRFYQNAE
jgi:hypothetical protein